MQARELLSQKSLYQKSVTEPGLPGQDYGLLNRETRTTPKGTFAHFSEVSALTQSQKLTPLTVTVITFIS